MNCVMLGIFLHNINICVKKIYIHSLIRSFRDERLKVAYRDYRI